MRHLLLQDWLGDIGNLHAGAILDDTQQNVPLLKNAGCALIEYTDEMGPWVNAFLSARAGSPLAQLGPLLMAAGVWGGGGGSGDVVGPATAAVPAVHTAAALTLTDDHRNSVLRVSGALNAVALRIPTTLTGGEAGDDTAFETSVLVVDLTHAVTIATGVGLLTPEEHYGPELITEVNTWVCIKVLRGKAYVAIVPPGVDAVESAPLVQGVHTLATRAIVPSDVGAVIPFSSALNAQTITVPHTLFGSQGANRAFVFTGEVRDITNPITLAGSGGLTLVYYGPRSTLTTVGDTFVVVVISATLARVYIAAAL